MVKFKRILSNVVILLIINTTNIQATSEIYHIQPAISTQNIIDKGIMKEYVVTQDEEMFISKNFSQAIPLKHGTIIEDRGEYVISLKESNKLITFEIADDGDNRAESVEELFEVIAYGMMQEEDDIKISIKGDYLDDMDYDKKIDMIVEGIHELIYKYPLFMLGTGDIYCYSNKIDIDMRYTEDNIHKGKTVIAKNALFDYINTLDLTMSDIEIQLQVVKDILDYVEYDYDSDNELKYDIQGLVDGNKVVCSGYSKLFMAIMNSIGIPTEYIIGYLDGDAHAWNIVHYGEETYHVDLTNADTKSRKDNYVNYINEKDDYMLLSHVWERDNYPVCDDNTYSNFEIYDVYNLDTGGEVTSNIIITQQDHDSAISKIIDLDTGAKSYYTYSKHDYSIYILND